jgi:FAD/FMN-containing dehydrogenase
MILYLVLSLSVLAHSCLASTDLNVGSICVDKDPGLRWLATMLSENSTIACSEQGSSAESEDRYWAAQVAKNASVVVFPSSSQDVSYTVQATRKTPLGIDYAFVSGGHSLTGASSSAGLVIDLKNLNRTTVLRDFPDPITQLATPVVMYEGGVTSLGLQSATNGTGWTALTARASTVGMGGFSTGGGIGFMANAHGYALDRLIALEVVLPSGEIVFATKTNQHSDLFWAIQGGSGQFGIVTKFYQKAFQTPSAVQVGFHVIADRSAAQSFRNIESFFRRHSDPFSLMYYALAYLPAGWPHAKPDEREHRTIRLIVTLW